MKQDKPTGPAVDFHLENKLSELEILRQSFEEKKKLADSYYDQLLRLGAEFDNYRKRVEKEKDELIEFGKEELLVKLLGILDSFDLAVISTKNEKNEEKSIREGVELIHKQLRELLEKEGVKKLETVGQQFDPDLHHAVEYQESDKHKDNEIIQEIQAGYFLRDRVIRPAMVVVARNKKEDSS